MPFDLWNAALTFQRLMEDVSRGLSFVFAYIDHTLLANSSMEGHASPLRPLFERLSQRGAVFNVTKSEFRVLTSDVLGHCSNNPEICPLRQKCSLFVIFPAYTS